MALRVERRDGTGERSVLIGMVVNRHVAAAVADKWERGMFASQWGNIVGGWAVSHVRKYGKAPGPAIENYFARWAETADRDTVKLVESFLGSINDEYVTLRRTVNPDFLIDEAARIFNRVRMRELFEQGAEDISAGNDEAAATRIEKFRRVEIGADEGIILEPGCEAFRAALEDTHREPLIVYPDAVAQFFEGALVRDGFISFLAKEKGGKSFFLMDLAVRAWEQGRNVAYFEAGDNSQHQFMRRIMARITGRPVRAGTYPYPTALEIPDADRTPLETTHETRSAKRDMTAEDADAAAERLTGRFRVKCYPNRTASINTVKSKLEEYGREGFVADVVVIDYADILAPIDGTVDRREQINDSWMAMRSLSQVYHCLVVTATQANAASYDAWILRRCNFSEDKRKFGQVTGFYGINQTPAENKGGTFRLNCLFHRDLAFSEEKCVYLAACLPIGNPCVLSTFGGF